jgi:hypothetical protein
LKLTILNSQIEVLAHRLKGCRSVLGFHFGPPSASIHRPLFLRLAAKLFAACSDSLCLRDKPVGDNTFTSLPSIPRPLWWMPSSPFKKSPVRGPGLQHARFSEEYCRPRALKRRIARLFERAASLIVLICSALFVQELPLMAQKTQSDAGYTSHALKVPVTGKLGFSRLAGNITGITFTNRLSDAAAAANQIRMNGSGVAAGDLDGDGWCDLYFCGLGGNRLYRNLGDWRFEDITDRAGVRCPGQYSTGAVLADVDGDGDLDLLVNSIGGGTRLFINDVKGHFLEATDRGLTKEFGAMTMALGDVDGNGTLDLYVANYRTTTIRSTGLDLLEINGQLQLRPEDRSQFELTPQGGLFELGEPDILYLNDGQGYFTPLPWTNGVFVDEAGKPLTTAPRDWGLSVMLRDMNEDGEPDIYVCNDFFTPDRVWINEGRGHFHALSPLALRCTSTFSMGIDFADINRDGRDDFLVVDMLSLEHRRRITQSQVGLAPFEAQSRAFERAQVKRNVLQLNRGDGTYAEISQSSGIDASEWSWTAVFLDVDLDGYEDVLITTGHQFDTQDSDVQERLKSRQSAPRKKIATRLSEYPRLSLRMLAFRNQGNLRFAETGREWGLDKIGITHGICCVDLDNDGDLDVITNDLNDEAGVYRNEGTKPRVAVRLKGSGANTRGIGAKIWLYGGAVPMQSQEMICGGRYLSCDDAMRVFAAGGLTNEMRIEVRWRSGKRSEVAGVRANRVYEIDETGAVGRWDKRQLERRAMLEGSKDRFTGFWLEKANDESEGKTHDLAAVPRIPATQVNSLQIVDESPPTD